MARLKTIGITLGDPSGIGAEVTAKALKNPAIHSLAKFKIIGDKTFLRRWITKLPRTCELIDLKNKFTAQAKPGHPNRTSGRIALSYLNQAIQMLREGSISALVTAPLSKETICSLGHHFEGHTEILADAFKIRKYGMMFVTDTLKTVLVTRHLPLARVPESLTRAKIFETIQLSDQALKNHFRIRSPRIAVCGLNPHAGEGGTVGKEEIKTIIPAIGQAKMKKIKVYGPYSADTLFNAQNSKNFDVIVAMYHDQGLIAVKTLYFDIVVNLTIGLPFVRTSPAHGTAFEIAGKGIADPSSMKEAIKLAVQLTR